MIDASEVEAVLAELVGVSWNGIGRALDMGVLTFGPPVEFRTIDGRSLIRTAFDLHLQTPFRISANGFLMGSGDMASRGRVETLYDHTAAYMETRLEANPLAVTKVVAGHFGDFRLDVEEGLSIEVFVVSRRAESWRLVRRLPERGDRFLRDGAIVYMPAPPPIAPDTD